MGYAYSDSVPSIITGTRNLVEWCEQWLAQGDTLAAHNGAHFDFPVLAYWSEVLGLGGVKLWSDAAHNDQLVCTAIAAQLNDIARGPSKKDWYPLKRVCRDWGVDVPLDKDSEWRLRYQELEHVPVSAWPIEARVYLENDVRALAGLVAVIPLPADTHRKTEQHFWLELSSFNGTRTDATRAALWGNTLRAKRATLAVPLTEAHLIRPDGTKNAKALALAICGADTSAYSDYEIEQLYPIVNNDRTIDAPRTPTGKICTNKYACEDSDIPIMLTLAEYNSVEAMLSREWPSIASGRAHTRYGLADTGRVTSSDPALQLIGTASEARSCFIAEEGEHLCIADWTMLELCCLGQVCVELGAGSTLSQALRDGRDIHTELAQSLANAGGFGSDPKTLRRLAKEANFGRGGGMGAATLRATARKRGLRFSLEVAQSLISVHARQWPEIAVYHRMIQQRLDHTDTMVHYRSKRVRGGLRFTNAANTLFQGLGADVNLSGLVACARAGHLARLNVHDEYHWSFKDPGEIETVRDILRKVSTDWLPHCPSRIEPVIVPDWSQKK
jgi:hypothetical protein